MNTYEDKFEIINLEELESNLNKINDIGKDKRINCPKCQHDSVIKKSHQVDVPKAIGFVLLLGASFAIVMMINAIILIRQKIKRDRLPKEIKDQIPENKMSLLGLNIPTKFKIVCSRCEYSFYENYDTGDMIVVMVFFFIFLILVLFIVFLFYKFR